MAKIEIKGPIVSNDVGWLYHWLGWDACCPKDIADGLEEAGGEDVVVEINSCGGICVYGFEIYNALMQYPGKVTAHVVFAASAASLPVCAADEALASDACIFMIHNTQAYAEGDYRDLQMEADALREFNTGIINAYVRKTGRSREELQSLMDNDTYMSPQKAIEYGFIDGYLYGDPNGNPQPDSGQEANKGSFTVMNAAVSVMPEAKAQEMISLIKMSEAGVLAAGRIQELPEGNTGVANLQKQQPESSVQNNSGNTDSDIATENETKKGDQKRMTLEEFLKENPEAESDMENMLSTARKEAAADEQNRLKALDEIAHSVTQEALQNAKYGETQMDARDLAYQAMLEDGKKAENYMQQAVEDSEASEVNNVGAGFSEKEDLADQAAEAAAYVNKMRRGGEGK